MKHTKTHGFTLLEMMIVVVIIGILAGIALPSYLRYIERGYQTQAHAELTNINSKMKIWLVKNPGSNRAAVETELAKQATDSQVDDAKVAEKYNFSGKMEGDATSASRRYKLLAVPDSSSGYKLSVWMDSSGNAYKCDTKADAEAFKTSGGCEKA
ncbi:PilX family type IV pilin [Neisseria sp.]|uniref:PilX family type IV pilin n=1 Tax=Neisseria sp. TaxID=192066 RepID=UPI00359F6D3B